MKKSVKEIINLVIIVVYFVGFLTLTTVVQTAIRGNPSLNHAEFIALSSVFLGIIGLNIYRFIYKILFNKSREIDAPFNKTLIKNYSIGAVFGILLSVTTYLLIYAFGGLEFVKQGQLWLILLVPIYAFSTAVIEETVFRGFLFRKLEDYCGTWIALIVSALVFGFMHVGNGLTVIPLISISLSGGVLMASVYLFSKRNLWAAMGVHALWNGMESIFWDTSGVGETKSESVFYFKFARTDWVTGGKVGVENTVFVIGICLLISIVLLLIVYKRGDIKKFETSKDSDKVGNVN